MIDEMYKLPISSPEEGGSPRLAVPVKVMSLGLALAAVAVVATVAATRHGDAIRPPFSLPFWVYAPAVVGAETLQFHVERKNQSHSFSLSELPVVIGLFFSSPVALLTGRLLGHLVYRGLVIKQKPLKLLFNICLFSAETSIATLLFRLIEHGAGPFEPGVCAAVLVAVALSDVVSMLAVAVVISWTGGETAPSAVVTTGLLTAGVNGLLSIQAVTILWANPWTLLLFLVAVVTFSQLYRHNAELRQRYTSLQMLYGFTQMVGASLAAQDVTDEILREARKLLRAATAELILLGEDDGRSAYVVGSYEQPRQRSDDDPYPATLDGSRCWSEVVRTGTPTIVPRGSRRPDHVALLRLVGSADAMIAPITSDGKVVGTIIVGDRQSNINGFDEDDLQIFATLANHASVAFENGRLVEQLRREADERRREALHDGLTGLANRSLFVQRLNDLISGEGRSGPNREACVMLMDLDRFKEVNDTLGHHSGDKLLTEVADRLNRITRSTDTVARLGGDEFAILVPDITSIAQAVDLATRIVLGFERPFQLDNLTVDIGASIGLAIYPDHGTDATTLLQRADVAMYQAKGGDNHIALYAPEHDHNSPERLMLATELRQALAEHQLEVYYQPKARLSDRVVVGSEALARWRHPTRGMVGPNEFIPIAEQIGLITPLTIFVLETALRDCKDWIEAGHDLSVSVNLSLRSLFDIDLPGQIQRLLDTTRVDAGRLTLEITESSVMADPTRTIAVLERLATLGVKLSVDDFGTGYSSLSYLRRLPVNEVKIDQSFVFRIGSDAKDAAVVRSIIELAGQLNLHTVAEGIEDQLSWDLLEEMGCDEAQGYFLSRPIPAPAMLRWLEAAAPSGSMPAGRRAVAAVRFPSVLVVDDDHLVRTMLAVVLGNEASCTVHEAGDGWEAVAMARRHQPDVVVLDLAMPRLSGMDALPSILAVTPNTRVVVVTSADDAELREAAINAGAWAVLDKADGIDEIQRSIHRLLGDPYPTPRPRSGYKSVAGVQPSSKA